MERSVKILKTYLCLRFRIYVTILIGFLLLISPLNLVAQVLSEEIKLNNASFIDVVKKIEEQTEYSFVMDYSDIESYAERRYSFNSNSLEEILHNLIHNTHLEYKIVNTHIVISINEKAIAKPVKISGRVLAEDQDPLPGVTIYVKGTTNGTICDLEGNYEIVVDNVDGAVLVFSYVGYETQEVLIGNKTEINITLRPKTEILDEVVIIGYGTAYKEEITSSIIQINESQLKSGATNNPIELIKGKVPGLSVVNQRGNDPNSTPQVNLRGIGTLSANNEPLIIIDGVYSFVSDLYILNPNDINSFNVLKDGASTAIYGTRGSNGVIIIKTKSGKTDATNLEYSSYYFLEVPFRKPEVLDNEQYIEVLRSLGYPRSETDKGYNTYWFDELIARKMSLFQSISFSKSQENSSIRVSLSHKDHNGIAVDTYNKTTNFRFNYVQSLYNRLEFITMISGSRSDQKFVDYNAFDEALKYDPTAPVYNDDGSYYELPGVGASNPLALLKQKENTGITDRFIGSLEGKLDIMPDLNVSIKGSTFLKNLNNSFFEHIDSRNSQISGIKGQAERSSDFFIENVFESFINYRYSRSHHHIKLMGGYSFIENERATTFMSNRNFLTNTFGADNIGAGSFLEDGKGEMESVREKSRLVAFFGRFNYSYEAKYLLNASIRREGSSVFGANNKWGWFPSLSAGWRLTEEEFLSNVDFINELKLRAGFGITGRSQGIPLYQSLSRIGYSGNAYFNGQWIGSYGPVENANPNLRWERTRELNIGIDFIILSDRVSGSLDAYDRLTIDLLGDYVTQTPPSIDPSIFANVGTLRNNGIEITASASVVQKNKLKLTLGGSYSYNHNELISLSNDQFRADSLLYADYGNVAASLYLLAEGLPIGTFYGFKFEGINTDGKWVFEDLNHDGNIQEVLDFTLLGNGLPKHMYSISANLNYSDLYLNVYFVGAAGFEVFNAKRLWYENTANSPSNYFTSILESPNDLLDDRLRFSDYYLEKGDYLRLENIALGYRFKTESYIKLIDVYLSATNIFNITGYSGLDPEVGSGTTDGLTPGWDLRSFYPRTSTYQLGMNLRF